jgi:hypothetical protein
MVTTFLNLVSGGKFDPKLYGFDSFFHLALVLTTDAGKNVIVEKNEVINISTNYKSTSKTEIHNIDFDMDITLNDFLKKAEESVTPAEWFLYNAFTANCQFFIRIILKSHNLYNEATDKFVFQNIEELVKKSPKNVGKIAKLITDTAGVVSRMTGKGSAKSRLNELLDKLKLINDVLIHGNKGERIKLANNLNVML